jgi:iron(III) transport system permease protein
MRPFHVFFKVILPVMWPAVLSAAVLIWVTTLSELSATLVLYSSGWGTIPVEIYQQIDSDRTALASAHSVILLLAVFLPLIVARLFGIKVLESQ